MKVLVMGANTKPEKYVFKAIHMLKNHGFDVNAIGLRPGNVAGVEIDTEKKEYTNLDTITLYLNPKNQQPYYDYFVHLRPRRVILLMLAATKASATPKHMDTTMVSSSATFSTVSPDHQLCSAGMFLAT